MCRGEFGFQQFFIQAFEEIIAVRLVYILFWLIKTLLS